jgi:serine/threonine-protein kinase
MSPDDAQRITDLFLQVVDLPPAERGAFLDRACGHDAAVRREVEALLAADAELEAGAGSPLWSASTVGGDAFTEPPRRVGPYRLIRRLGQGGMSEVFLALRDDGELQRRVAIKLIRRDLLTAEMVRRFETERQILASLDHPSIARLLDAGRTADGVPYFVMEYIEGEPIDLYCDRHRLPIAKRLEIFREVCFAVHFAHQNLVVHRDIKPRNILVTATGQPKLLDFGIAKLLNPDLMAHGNEPTVSWRRLLTPEYASPEQILGKPITTASDIYSLGVLLFKLLTGADPYRLRERQTAEVEQLILTAEPDAPSAFVRRLLETPDTSGSRWPTAEELAAARGTQPRALARALAGDLDAITARALRKESQNRYVSAEQMAEDVRRHLAGGRVFAPGVTASPSVLRGRRGLAAGVFFVLSLVAATSAFVVQTTRLAETRAVAQGDQARAEEIASSVQRLFEEAGPGVDLIDRAAERFRQDLAGQPETQADLSMALGRAYFRMGLFEEAASSLEAALTTRRRLFGAEHEKVAESLTALAEVDTSQGDYDAAEAHHRRALAMRRKIHPGDSLEVTESLVGFGRVMLADGHAPHSEPALLEALAMRARLLGGEGNLRVAEIFTVLGHTVDHMGSPSAAEFLFRKASKIQRRTFGNESWELAASLVNQAAVLFEQGKRDEGGALLREVARIERHRCGDKSTDLATSLGNLAGATLQATPPVRSLPCRMPPLDVPHQTYLLQGLGDGLMELGYPVEARPFLQQSSGARRPPAPPPARRPDSSRVAGGCVPDGGFAETLGRPCCSGVIVGGTTLCSDPKDWGATWRTCRHVCGSQLVDGCVPSGGADDLLQLTDCCSGSSASGSVRCLNPADYGTTWRTCVQRCA